MADNMGCVTNSDYTTSPEHASAAKLNAIRSQSIMSPLLKNIREEAKRRISIIKTPTGRYGIKLHDLGRMQADHTRQKCGLDRLNKRTRTNNA